MLVVSSNCMAKMCMITAGSCEVLLELVAMLMTLSLYFWTSKSPLSPFILRILVSYSASDLTSNGSGGIHLGFDYRRHTVSVKSDSTDPYDFELCHKP